MRMRDTIRARKGEIILATLWLFKVLCRIPGVCEVYRLVTARLVRDTGLFDEAFYLENNPDIAESGMLAVHHYVSYGDVEGRSPMPFFEPQSYRKSARGLKFNINTLLHYSYVGRHKRISPSPWFDVKFYLSNNKDVARTGMDPIIHYMEWGGVEGRSPCSHFDGDYYLKSNPDVSEQQINPLFHYLRYGRQEGRRCTPECGHSDYAELMKDASILKPVLPSEEDWEGIHPQESKDCAEIDVVIPVYKGFAETLRCIYSVLSAKTEANYELIVINDGSPEAELVGELKRLSSIGLFTLVSNDRNRGFVYTANKGLLLHDSRDVLLLNSDTEVYDGWLDRIYDAARRNEKAGTLTPLSNNATICSYPHFPEENPFPLELKYEDLDALVAKINVGAEVEAPTGVGFCMYVKRQCINDIGVFDERLFGKGYGEENDFCQRAIKRGWKNIIIANVFVRHFGSVSFQGEKAKLSERAMKVIEKKHKNYKKDVATFIKVNPLQETYRKMDFARLLRMRRDNNILIVSHGRGGGTERCVQESISRLVSDGYGVYVMRPDKCSSGYVVFEHPSIRELPNLPLFSWSDVKSIRETIEALHITEVHVHSFVDFGNEVPVLLKDLLAAMGIALQVYIHDYEVICPRINLIDENGAYCGEQGKETCNNCLMSFGSDSGVEDILEWRSTREAVLMSAEKIVAPDQDVAVRLKKYYSEVKVDVIPHDKSNDEIVRLREPVICDHEKLRVVVVGAVSKLKGYEVLLNCARNAKQRNLPLEFQLMGYSLNDRLLENAGVRVVGKYRDSEALERLSKLEPHAVFLPSITPETYSYTLSLAFKTGLPVFAFDIGAIARRLRDKGMVHGIMPLDFFKSEEKVNGVLLRYRERVICQSEVGVYDGGYETAPVAAIK